MTEEYPTLRLNCLTDCRPACWLSSVHKMLCWPPPAVTAASPSCRLAGEGGAGSGAALSRRLSRKSTEPQSQAGAPEPRAQVEVLPSRRDTGCDTRTDRESSNNGTTPATWRAAHVHKTFSNAEKSRHAGSPGFCFRTDVNGCCWAAPLRNAFSHFQLDQELDGRHLNQSILTHLL